MGLVALPPIASDRVSLARDSQRGRHDADFAASLRGHTKADAPEGGPELLGWRRTDHPGQGHAYGRAARTEPATDGPTLPAEDANQPEGASAAEVLAASTLPAMPLATPDPGTPVLNAEALTPPPIPIEPPAATVAGPLTAGATQESHVDRTSDLALNPIASESSAPADAIPEPVANVDGVIPGNPATPSLPETAAPAIEAATEVERPSLAVTQSRAADETAPAYSSDEHAEVELVPPTVETSNASDGGNPGSRGSADAPRLPVAAEVERPLPKAAPQAIAHAADASAVAQLREPSTGAAPAAVESAAPQAPVDLPEPVQQVSQVIVEAIEQGGGEARLHLKPAELGEVVIRLQIEGTEVRLQVHAERPEAMQLLREHRLELTNLLGDRGLDLSELYMGLGGRDSSGADGQGESVPANQRRGESEFAGLLGIDAESPIANHQRLRAAYNPDGAHVYRV